MHYSQRLRELYQQHADPTIAKGAKAYMRNQFEFMGIPAPLRRQLNKGFLQSHPLPQPPELYTLVHHLWTEEEREFQYFAMDSLYTLRKRWQEDILQLFEHCVVQKSWWDTVDFIASKLVGEYFRRFPEQMYPRVLSWIGHKNMWLNRTAIIFQLSYKKNTDCALLTEAILRHAASKEFFHQKAIGWALRQYSYTNSAWVERFIADHTLQPLSVREGLKAIRRNASAD